MSVRLGICTSTEGYENPRDLADLSPSVARFVLTKDRAWLPEWHAKLGIKSHGVVAAETFRSLGLDPLQDFAACAVRVRDEWTTQLAYAEIGNEPDDTGGSSYSMKPEQFTKLLWAFDDVLHQGQHERPILISGGLNSGQPDYANAVDFPPCMLLGLHDYDSRLRNWPWSTYGNHDLDFYLGVYKPQWSRMRGVAITEWGHTSQQEEFGADYVRRWIAIVREHPEVELAEFFALSDKQHIPHGLLRADRKQKAQFGAYAQAIKELDMAVDPGVEARLKKIEADLKFQEEQRGFLWDEVARILSGNWHEGDQSAEALLRAINDQKYGTFEAVPFPKR